VIIMATRFLTFFPGCEDMHLLKDVGMIPYHMAKLPGNSGGILTYDNGPYPRLSELPGLQLFFIPHLFPVWLRPLLARYLVLIEASLYLIGHAKNIDVLQFYHLGRTNAILSRVYKLLNPSGISYIKLDGSTDPPYGAELYSVETGYAYNILRNYASVVRLPNGLDHTKLPDPTPYPMKERLIVHSGRLGIGLKASEIVVDTFARISADYQDWRLALIGPTTPEFKEYCDEKIRMYGLEGRVLLPGYISDTRLLYDVYNRARIVFMPSRSESWCLALLECMALGAIPLVSSIPVFAELTCGTGYMCKVDDKGGFEAGLRFILDHEEDMAGQSQAAIKVARQYDWQKIVARLAASLEAVR